MPGEEGMSCAKCGGALNGPFLEIAGQRYHPACLTCDVCSGPIDGGFCEEDS